MLRLLFISWPDWEIPWAGIGTALMGVGSFLSGLGAYKMATKKNEPKPEDRGADRK